MTPIFLHYCNTKKCYFGFDIALIIKLLTDVQAEIEVATQGSCEIILFKRRSTDEQPAHRTIEYIALEKGKDGNQAIIVGAVHVLPHKPT